MVNLPTRVYITQLISASGLVTYETQAGPCTAEQFTRWLELLFETGSIGIVQSTKSPDGGWQIRYPIHPGKRDKPG